MATPPLTLSIGSAEHTMRALLERELTRDHMSFAQWTALVFTRDTPISIQEIMQRQLAGHIVTSENEAHGAIADLVATGTLSRNPDGSIQHSKTGRDLFDRVSSSVERIKNTLYGDLPEADLEAVHRVLLEITARADKLLTSR